MPDETKPAGTQADPSQNPGSENMSHDEAKKLRAESASLRKRLAELEAKSQADELAKLSDAEKVMRERDSLREQYEAAQVELQSMRLMHEVVRHAPSLNLVDSGAAQVLLTASGEVEYDDKGQPTNVAKLLEKLVAEKPWLVASNVTRPPAPPSSGGATNPPRSAVSTTPATPKPSAKDMYAAHRKGGGLTNPQLWKGGSSSNNSGNG